MQLISTPTEQWFVIFLLIINTFAVFIMASDKWKATRGRTNNRTSEKFIFFVAIILGATGVYIGMRTFRHKTQKWYFQIGIPLLVTINAIVVYFAIRMILF